MLEQGEDSVSYDALAAADLTAVAWPGDAATTVAAGVTGDDAVEAADAERASRVATVAKVAAATAASVAVAAAGVAAGTVAAAVKAKRG